MAMDIVIEKARNFFEYLLALNNLVGKVTRNYSEYEKNWHVDDLKELEGCFILEDCQNVENILEIHRPDISEEEKQPPKPDKILTDWVNFNIFDENSTPSYIEERLIKDEEGEEQTESFADNNERKSYYFQWVSEWRDWAENLKEKKLVLKLYSEFFNLISRFEVEGESLEFIFGSGLLCWKHPDPNVGLIRSPLLTAKLELEIDAENGIVSAKPVNREVNFEREMFTGVKIPNIKQINQLIRNVQIEEFTYDFSDFYNQFIHLLDAGGKFIEDFSEIKVGNDPIIYDYSIFSLRSKNVRVLRNDLENILTSLTNEEIELPDAVVSILGEGKNNNNIKSNNNNKESEEIFSENDLYFPLESNEQQKEIINRIERNHGVTIQGPPGTGKSHTIANLVSHFLSEGKKILITSQKENPLKVIKNKIPKEIRDLCVPVLGGGRESLQEIEQSIRVIGEKLGELDVRRLNEEIKRDKENLNKSKRFVAQLKNQLRQYAEKEGTELDYKDEKLFKYDVAKRLSESIIDYTWIQDNISMDQLFPLSSIDFKELWDLKCQLTKENLLLQDQFIPEIDTQILSSTSFSNLMERGKNLEQYDKDGQEIIEKFAFPKEEALLQQLLAEFKGVLGMSTILDNTYYKSIIEDCKAGGIREKRWRSLLDEMISANEKMFEHYNSLITHKVTLPEKNVLELKSDIEVVKERLVTGKKPNFLFFMVKGKQVKYLFETPVLDGKPLNSIEDIKPLEIYLQYIETKREAARIFNGNMEEIGHAIIEEQEKRFPHLLEERLKELQLVLQVVDTIETVYEKMKPYKMEEQNFYSIESSNELVNQMEIAIKHVQFQQWLETYNKKLLHLNELNNIENSHPIIQEYISAFESKDVPKWIKLIESLSLLDHTKRIVNRFYELLNLFNSVLPLTGKSIEMTVGSSQDLPTDFLEAFELKKLQTWLDETKDINIGKIKKQLNDEHEEQMKLIGKIVSNSTWKNQIERITDEEKRALSAWKTFIKRYGAGTGKYAQKHLQGAREEMKTAQSAIPVWIMPINQVLENFPVTNDKFDVIIFDESSQCDLFSINVLLRGKKAIVVGDEEQISPQAIGINLEDVYELVRRHLSGIPNANLFDGNISLYEIAEQTFPKEGKLMLREHFRCVPEIIQFSNDLSYGGEMIPLRLPLENEKIEPPVVSIKVNDGYNDEKEKDINVPEVDAIVADMLIMINNPIYDNQTFGVITLQGQKQHKLMETRIREKIGDREFVKRKIICGNPYTLQGDERDIIFLSMVVAPNRRFRSLVKTSEKQRFNVAASRAKNQMRLYHSVELEDLSTDDLRYRLLSYCKNPTRLINELENLEEKCESPFEIDVLRMILSRGYKVTPQVEVGRYRIDLVIEGLRDRLAVECDGEKWHGPEKFEEDIQRQESLERAGWKFWRIRGREFYFNKNKAMENLWERLSEMGIETAAYQEKETDNLFQLEELKDNPIQNDNQEDENGKQLNYFTIRKNSDVPQKRQKLKQINKDQMALFDGNLEGYSSQISLFDEGDDELFPFISGKQVNKSANTESFSLYQYLINEGLEVIDQRDKGGSIWVIGDESLQPIMQQLNKMNIIFKYAPNGSRSTHKKPAWYSKYRD